MTMTTMICLIHPQNHLPLLNRNKSQHQLSKRLMTVMIQTTTLRSSSQKQLLSSNQLNRKNQLLWLQTTRMISNPLLCNRGPNNPHLVLKRHQLHRQPRRLQKVLHLVSHQLRNPNKRVKRKIQVPRECQLLNSPQRLTLMHWIQARIQTTPKIRNNLKFCQDQPWLWPHKWHPLQTQMEVLTIQTSKKLPHLQKKRQPKKWSFSIQMTMSQFNNRRAPSSTNRKLTNKTIINKIKIITTTTNSSTITVNSNTTTTNSSSMKNQHRFTRQDHKPHQLLMLSKLSPKKITVTNKRHPLNNLFLLKMKTRTRICHTNRLKSNLPHNSKNSLCLLKIKIRMMIIPTNKLKSKVLPSS